MVFINIITVCVHAHVGKYCYFYSSAIKSVALVPYDMHVYLVLDLLNTSSLT